MLKARERLEMVGACMSGGGRVFLGSGTEDPVCNGADFFDSLVGAGEFNRDDDPPFRDDLETAGCDRESPRGVAPRSILTLIALVGNLCEVTLGAFSTSFSHVGAPEAAIIKWVLKPQSSEIRV